MAKITRYLPQFIGIWLVTTVALLAAAKLLLAERNGPQSGSFRLETRVFVDARKAPASSNVTIFSDGLVFDYLNSGQETTLLDVTNRQFIVLDPARSVKTVISLDQLLLYGSWLTDVVGRQNDPLLTFCAEPNFQVSEDAQAGVFRFDSSVMSYSVASEKPDRPEVADQFREFSDWYARLNSLLNPRALPPFARLTVNERLARNGLLPQQVRLHLAAHPRFGGNSLELKSEHAFRYELSGSDLARIQQTRRQLAEFREVTPDEYRQIRQ